MLSYGRRLLDNLARWAVFVLMFEVGSHIVGLPLARCSYSRTQASSFVDHHTMYVIAALISHMRMKFYKH